MGIGRKIYRAVAGALALLCVAPAMAQEAQPQDETTRVEGIEVFASIVPVPKVGDGAPQLSVEQLAAIAREARRDNSYYSEQAARIDACYVEAYQVGAPEERVEGYNEAHTAAQRLAAFAQAAQYAVGDALLIRRKAATGQATQAEVEAAELARQKAVLRVVAAQNELAEGKAKAIDVQELAQEKTPFTAWRGILRAKAAERASAEAEPWNPAPKEFRDLAIHSVQAVTREDAKDGVFIRVTGFIKNTREKRIAIPPLSVSAIDEEGFPISSSTAMARGRIAPGESIPFAYDVRPIPPRAKTVAVTFGDPKRPAWLLPASADPVCMPPAPEDLNPGSGRPPVMRPARAFLQPG